MDTYFVRHTYPSDLRLTGLLHSRILAFAVAGRGSRVACSRHCACAFALASSRYALACCAVAVFQACVRRTAGDTGADTGADICGSGSTGLVPHRFLAHSNVVFVHHNRLTARKVFEGICLDGLYCERVMRQRA